MLCSVINQHTYRQKLLILISKICLFSILILICYIFSTNKVLEIRLVVLIPLTTIPKFNWQLCLNLTNPNFAWFNSHSTKKVPMLGLASSYLRTSILSVFYGQCAANSLNWQCKVNMMARCRKNYKNKRIKSNLTNLCQ